MKSYKILFLLLIGVLMSVSFSSCSDEEESSNKDFDKTLYGEWVEDSDNSYVFDYYCFYPDGTGIHGSWESDIDWVNEDDDIKWYTEDAKYLYINGSRYEYRCNGSSLEIKKNGRTRRYYEK